MKICERNVITRLSLGIAFVLGGAISAEAATINDDPAYVVDSNLLEINGLSSGITTGLEFTVGLEDITVTAIGAYLRGFDNGGGFFNPGNLELAASREVAIWTVGAAEDNSLIVPQSQNLITEGAANTFTKGDFVYLDLAATGNTFDLLANTTYRIGSFIDGVVGDYTVFENGVSFNPVLSATPNTVQANNNIEIFYPDQQSSTTQYSISANFLFDTDTNGGGETVPEPSLMGGLMLFGLVGLLQKRSY
ncbi:MAG: hypothetical protein AB4041_14010 [Microcystaceae cyanobacterium]